MVGSPRCLVCRATMDKAWPCSACTFLNAGQKVACEMCGTRAPVAGPHVDQDATHTNSVASGPGADDGWSCSACTYLNPHGLGVCSICGTQGEPVPVLGENARGEEAEPQSPPPPTEEPEPVWLSLLDDPRHKKLRQRQVRGVSSATLLVWAKAAGRPGFKPGLESVRQGPRAQHQPHCCWYGDPLSALSFLINLCLHNRSGQQCA